MEKPTDKQLEEIKQILTYEFNEAAKQWYDVKCKGNFTLTEYNIYEKYREKFSNLSAILKLITYNNIPVHQNIDNIRILELLDQIKNI